MSKWLVPLMLLAALPLAGCRPPEPASAAPAQHPTHHTNATAVGGAGARTEAVNTVKPRRDRPARRHWD